MKINIEMEYEEFQKMKENAEIGQFVTDYNEKKKELEKREKAVKDAEGKVKIVYEGFLSLDSKKQKYVNITEIEEKGLTYDWLKNIEESLREELNATMEMNIFQFMSQKRRWK